MSYVIPFFLGAVFDASLTRAMGEAYDMAEKDVVAAQPGIAKEVIARRIIAAARRGERDPKRLCKIAINARN